MPRRPLTKMELSKKTLLDPAIHAVHTILMQFGLTHSQAEDAINTMHVNGIDIVVGRDDG